MFTRLFAHLQMRQSTAFLLARQDDHLLEDIGLTRADLHAMHIGLDATARPMPMACHPTSLHLPA